MRQGTLSALAAAAIFSVFSFAGVEAQGQSPFIGNGYGYKSNCLEGNYYGLYALDKLFVPPYFAMHPPVYYSAPVARPYGYTPYALPPGMLPAEMLAGPQPEEIINPYVEEEEVEATTSTTQGKVAEALPQWIMNPFVEVSLQEFAAVNVGKVE